MDTKIFRHWSFWLMVGLFVLAIILTTTIESLAENKNTLLPLLGLIPIVGIWYFAIVKKSNK